MRSSIRVALACGAIGAMTGTAHASPGITGYSGKPYNGVTDTCATICHASGGAKPTLEIDVPAALEAGQTAQVKIVVNGTRARTSMNAALSDGVKAAAGQNTDIPFPVETPGEVAATTPPPAGADGTFEFSFIAPNKNGPITLWVAGMSSDGNGTGGDGVATATRTITISGATEEQKPTSDGGASSSSSSTSSSGGESTNGPSDEDDEDDGDGTGGKSSRRLSSTAPESSSCGVRSSPRAIDASSAWIGLVALASLARRRFGPTRSKASRR